MAIQLSNSVVVITGASSGIGRATAEAFARRGATLVLAARRANALEDVARECEHLGGKAMVVKTDVADEAAVERLARRAIEAFGRVDVWINDAAVTLFGRFDECPSAEYRRVIETNLMGCIHGARAAMQIFREQGRGILINVSSVVAAAPQPYTSAYCLTKAAIRSLSESLRMELVLDQARDIHVCTVMPASIDTPIFQHAANHTGRAVKALDPVYPPEQVADAIVRLVRHPKREVIVGNAGRMMQLQSVLAPAMYERTGAWMIDRNHLQNRPADATRGNLFEPSTEGSQRAGGWRECDGQRSGGTSKTATTAVALGAAALLYSAWRWRESQANCST